MSERNEFNNKLIAEFRANGGKVGGQFAGFPLLLLTTTGRKSGQSLTKPLVYTTDGNRIVLIASFAGAAHHPACYLNLSANPTVTVELGAETFKAKASTVAGAERDRLYKAQADKMPIFNDYQKKTTRQIPVVVLERVQ